MTKEEVIREIKINKEDDTYVISEEASDMIIEALEQKTCEELGYGFGEKVGWIPTVTRPLTDEERKEHDARIDFMYDCTLPSDGQEVLVSTSYGFVRQTEFHTDYGYYFEGYEYEGEVTAWMPLPKPYKSERSEE